MAPGVEVLLERQLERRQVQLLQAPDLRRPRTAPRDAGQGGPCQRLERLTSRPLREQPLEARGVDAVAAPIAARIRRRASRYKPFSPDGAIALRSCET